MGSAKLDGFSDTYLHGESYKSLMRIFSPMAIFSSVANLGLAFPFRMSEIVDFGTPVRSDTWRMERLRWSMIFPNNIVMLLFFTGFYNLILEENEVINFLSNLLLTAFAYLIIPILISLSGMDYNLKSIKKLVVLNAIAVWIILSVWLAEVVGVGAAGSSVFLWSYVAYRMLARKCSKKVSDDCFENISDSQAPLEEADLVEENVADQSDAPPRRVVSKAVIVLSSILLLSAAFNIVCLLTINNYNKEMDYLKYKAESEKDTANAVAGKYRKLKKEHESYVEDTEEKMKALDKVVVYVLDGYGNYYYTYDQVQIVTEGADEYSYWVYIKEDAISQGYKPWKK